MTTLIAGVGNIFFGDDGFGVEVIRRLAQAPPEDTTIVDFGIRGVHLAYEMLAPHDLVVIADCMARGQPPGTLYVLDPEHETTRAIDDAASPFGDADGRAQGPAVDDAASPFGDADGRAQGPAVDDAASPFGDADGRAQGPAVDDAASPFGDADGRAQGPAVDDAHGMHLPAVFASVRAMGGKLPPIRIVGCEPATTDPQLGLSDVVERALPAALELVRDTIRRSRARARQEDTP